MKQCHIPKEWNPQTCDCEHRNSHCIAWSESVKAPTYVYRSYAMQAFVRAAPMPDNDPMKAKIWQATCPAANPLLNEL